MGVGLSERAAGVFLSRTVSCMTPSPEFLAEQKSSLVAEQQRLEDELSRIARKDPTIPGEYDASFPDYGRAPDENALEEETYEARRGVEQSLELHLHDVRRALEQIEAGTYGVCRVCQDVISEDRLKAFPAATTCITHAGA